MATIKKNKTCHQLYLQYLDKTVSVKIDRPINSLHPKHKFRYLVNYGFIPNTKAPEGEEIDAYVLGVVKRLKRFTGRCIAIIHRLNDDDDKLVVVQEGKNLNNEEIKSQTYFQEKFFESEIIR